MQPCVGAGDTVKKLLWRLKNGEVPLKREPRVAVVLVGTEDLVSPACADPITAPRTAAELRGLLVYMHRCDSVSTAQPPRRAHTLSTRSGTAPCCLALWSLQKAAVVFPGTCTGVRFCPDRMPAVACRRMPAAQIVAMGVLPKGQTWPNTCTEAITQANQRLQEYAERHKPWLSYIDVGDRFLTHQVCTLSSNAAATSTPDVASHICVHCTVCCWGVMAAWRPDGSGSQCTQMVCQSRGALQDDGQGHQEIVPSLLTQDTLNPSHYGIRIIATELEPVLDRLAAQVVMTAALMCCHLEGMHIACPIAW